MRDEEEINGHKEVEPYTVRPTPYTLPCPQYMSKKGLIIFHYSIIPYFTIFVRIFSKTILLITS